MTTTALNLNPCTNPTSNLPSSLPDGASLLSNLRLPNTVIIQPPSSIITRPSSLLAKRYNPSELGDLLLKKIKTQNSSSNSPTQNTNQEDNHILENNSMIEEVSSPSIKSFCEENEAQNPQKLLEGILMPQRSNTAPLMFNTFNLRHPKSGADPHRQVQHALEVLQKKLLMDQQASVLKDLLLKAQLAQEPLIIPPLLSASNSTQSSFKSGKSNESNSVKPIKPLKNLENEQEVFYGEIEYPLLSMAPPGLDGTLAQKDTNLPGSTSKTNDTKVTARNKNGSFESLSATRAETQSLESEANSSCISEESPKRASTKKNINKKRPEVNKRGQKQVKEQGRDKSKAELRKQRNDELLSPLLKGKKMTERKKNKWQTGEAAVQKQTAGNDNTESQNNS